MVNHNFFDKKYLNLFSPYGDGIEFLHDILYSIGYTNKNLNSEKGRELALNAIEFLLEKDLITIFNWGMYQDLLGNIQFNKAQNLSLISNIWKPGTDFPTFYNLVIFTNTKWFREKIEKLGFTHTTNWETFVDEKIGDLEIWIEENRPKDENKS